MVRSSDPPASPVRIAAVETEEQLGQLLPLMRAYCDGYDAHPSDANLLAMSRALIADPSREGLQVLATIDGRAVGFATVFWSWATTIAARIAVMNDLFVAREARRAGIGAALIDACRRRAHDHSARRLVWQTAPENVTAQALYDRIGAHRETWVDYWIDV